MLDGTIDDGYDEDDLTPAELLMECGRCKRKGHQTAGSSKCPYYKQRKKKAAAPAAPPAVVGGGPLVAAAAAAARRDAADAERFDSMPLNDDAVDDDDESVDGIARVFEAESDDEGGSSDAPGRTNAII